MAHMSVAPARPASTVVLLRPAARRFEVFLVRRHDKVAFMGGAHVFPGGRVEERDRLAEPERICEGVAEAVARLADLPAADAVAAHVAAIRELFEEAGVLLANPVDPQRIASLRRNVEAGTLTLEELAARERLRFALDAVVAFAHWVTPEIEIKRFDTRFFAAIVPDGQQPAHDDGETTHGEWLDPAEAVERCRREEISLPPPTWTTLRMLSRLSGAEEVLRWARQQRIVRVQPRFIRNDVETALTLPGDPTFPAIDGFETPDETRFILSNGRWRPAR